ncbi:DUF547 domain-containing protein [Solidesulfovibrio alcoholivorans]|uniref:DUF547 domain-containing protein n=1 Tax=Solidesulfovibrio alcoholivorans TaxID=81406 RepID=UPI000495E538|nr:DUF547 domain-containing protein [Solidesulfovibrio alcoholivorans]
MAGRIVAALCALAFFFTAAASRAADRDAPYAALLAAHVADGVVDYAGLKKDEATLDNYLAALAAVDPAALSGPERFAYYINVYNAWTLKLILEHYPGIRSIKDAGNLFRSPWQRAFVRLRAGTVSLDDVEHGILRPQFHDPRVHFAVNCASKSCPPLAGAPYAGATLDAALDAAARACINNPANTFFKDGTLHVSRIFDWYGEDFGGPEGVWRFIRRYAAPPLAAAMDAAGRHELAYTPYDWSLNGR